MTELDDIIWLMFMLIFAILPIKPIFKTILRSFSRDTNVCVEEENYDEERYSQLYRPGDKKYNKINKLSNKAKLIK